MRYLTSYVAPLYIRNKERFVEQILREKYFIRTKGNYKERMKEVPIEKGTGQSDCEISANCDKKNLLTPATVRLQFFLFLVVVRTALHKEKNIILRIDVQKMVTFSIHIGIVKKCVSSNRFFFFFCALFTTKTTQN